MRNRWVLVAAMALAACAQRRPAPTPTPPPPPVPVVAPPPPAPPPAPAVPPAPADYFPLAIGNTWTFLHRASGEPAPSHHVVRIIRRDPDGYFVDDQGGALRADDDCLHDRVRRLLCRPIDRGAAWASVPSSTVTERYRILAVGETVTVPAGTFQNCVRVRSQAWVGGTEQVAELTYAAGVGLIRLDTSSVQNGTATLQIHSVLESYRVVAGVR